MLSNIEPSALWRQAGTDKLVEKIVKHGQSSLISLTHHFYNWLEAGMAGLATSWHQNSMELQLEVGSGGQFLPSVPPYNPATWFWPPSATVVSTEPFLHWTGTQCCLLKEMATCKHWSVSLWRDSDDVPHCWILSSDKAEWRLIPAALWCCFLADQLWFMTGIREEED